MMLDDQDAIATPKRAKAAWMITFTDLVSLMLTFFVLLYSMSSLKIDKWEEMIDTLSQTLNPSKVETEAAATAEFNIGSLFRKSAENLDYLYGVLERGMAANDVLAGSQMMLLEDRLVITLPSDLLFTPGSAEMPLDTRAALYDLGSQLRNVANQIGVNGHSDPAPPRAETGYNSNWELSMARAIAVANTLMESGYEEVITSYGYADTRYAQLPKSWSDDKRNRLARRVDIVIFPNVGGD